MAGHTGHTRHTLVWAAFHFLVRLLTRSWLRPARPGYDLVGEGPRQAGQIVSYGTFTGRTGGGGWAERPGDTIRGARSMKPLLYFLTLLVAAACLAAGCRAAADAPVSIGRDEVPPARPEPLVPVLFGPTADRQTDPFTLNAAAVSGHILAVSVSYSGGCRSHLFVLTAAESFRESSPVQLPMVLTHDANEDPCEAYPTRQLRFDLAPIRERYQGAYGQDSGTVLLLLHSAHAADQPLVYRF